MNAHLVPLVQAISWDLSGAACKHLTRWWGRCERALDEVQSTDLRRRILARAISHCHRCPVQRACGERARIDRYTGIAGGAEYRNGRRLTPWTTS